MEVFFSDTVREPTDYAAGPMEAAMTSHKLSNVMLKVDDHMSAYPQAYYRAEGSATFDAGALAFSGTVDFLAYFKAFQTRFCFFSEQNIIRRIVQDFSYTCNTVLAQI